MAHDSGLLSEIERDLLDGKPLADTLRKCVVLGGRSNSQELRDWASQELRGYNGETDLPAYRCVPAPLMIDAIAGHTHITGQRISPSELPDVVAEQIKEEVELRDGVGQLEALIAGAGQRSSVKLSPLRAADIARLMDAQSGNPFQQVLAFYWAVSPSAIHGALDQTRTTLAELISELRAIVPPSQDTPTAAQAAQAVNVAVYGSKPRVEVTTAQASGTSTSHVSTVAPQEAEADLWSMGRKVGAAAAGLAGIVAAIVAVLEWRLHQ